MIIIEDLIQAAEYSAEIAWRYSLYKNWKLFQIRSNRLYFRCDGLDIYFHKWLCYDSINDWLGCLANNGPYWYRPVDCSKQSAKSVVNRLLADSKICPEQDNNLLRLLILVAVYTLGAAGKQEKRQLAECCCSIPAKYQSVPLKYQFLYRTIFLAVDFSRTNNFVLTPAVCSSWSTSKQFCKDFVNGLVDHVKLNRIILRLPVQSADVIVNLSHPDFSRLNIFSFQKEVLLRGTGLPNNTIKKEFI